jgi:DNA-binding LacI/PurR family transcriptional regulator
MPYEVSTFDAKGGRDAMNRLLAVCPEIDGVVCATDTMAMGALSALRDAGKDVPGEISIVGVGDDWIDTVSTPALTTAHLFFRQCGEEAARMLLENTDLRMTEICERAGFGDVSSLSRYFRREVGVTPTQYRASNRQERRSARQSGSIQKGEM